MKSATLCVAVVLGVALALPRRASAHAFPDHAEPRVGSTVAGSPAEVKIWFTEDVEPAATTIQVFDAQGREVDRKDSHPGANDNSVMIVSLPPLGPGTYKVVWSAACTCSHKTHGEYKFDVQSR